MPRVTFRNRLDPDLPGTVDATATLWVDAATGDDSRSKATVAASGGSLPWATLWRAVNGSAPYSAANTSEAAAAGDVVSVMAGTYSAPGTNTRNNPAFNPANSGTVSNRITFRANGTVTLRLSSGTGPTLGSYVRDYITWQGFTVNEQPNAVSIRDTGPVVAWDCDGTWFIDCTIDGGGLPTDTVVADNHTGIRVEVANDTVIRGCRISNVDSYSNTNNGAGIMLYGSERLLVERCEIATCGSGIFLKGGPSGGGVAEIDGHTIRYNYIHDIEDGGIVSYAGTPANATTPTKCYQNLIVNCGSGLIYWHFDAQYKDPTRTHYINNTLVNCTAGLTFNGSDITWGNVLNEVWNNIFSGLTNGIASTCSSTFHQDKSKYDFEHNVWHNASGNLFVLNGGGTNLTLAQWQGGSYVQDNDAPAGSSSDPLFVGGGDYHLQGGSPYATQGRVRQSIGGTNGDTIPAGCYITGSETIGL